MKVTLHAAIPVERFAVFADMAFLERRPELTLLCRAAREAGGKLSADDVMELLPGLSETGARNVLSWARELGLLDASGGLTRLGQDVADNGEAPVPEQGLYEWWAAAHPLLGARILHVERLSASPEGQMQDIGAPPVTPDRGVPFRSALDPKMRFLLREMPGAAPGALKHSARHAPLDLTWTWDMGGGREAWRLHGALVRHQPAAVQSAEETAGVDLWAAFGALAETTLRASGRWDREARLLRCAFEGLDEAARDKLRRDFLLPEAEAAGKGRFQQVQLEAVPIGPATATDARRWALDRWTRRASTQRRYLPPADVRRIFAECVEDTPLEPFRPELPGHADRCLLAANDPALYWSLAASVDLCPDPVDPSLLAPLAIGGTAPPPVQTGPRTVRIPYGGRWSMAELLEAVIAADRPRRLLLCDRYARGEQNLRQLDLLQRSLKARHPEAKLEVCNEGADDAERIRAITGAPPRSFTTEFGKARGAWPHDRYLLVDLGGRGYCWHLSNSPLDGRPDPGVTPDPRTPLRWRDLLALREEPAVLIEGLRHWWGGRA